MEMFFEIHKGIPREGPGSNEATKRAITLLPNMPSNPTVLDIGCGPGMQTIEIAENIDGKVYAIDVHKPFLDKLQETAVRKNLSDKVEPKEMSMFSLEFDEEYFDLVWCEGAIYIMGFEKALDEWKKHIKPDGYLVVSEISWIHKDIPEEPKNFWENAYPAIKGIADNIKVIEEHGYQPVAHFILPENCWWDDYYTPLVERINKLREKYVDNKEANDMMDDTMQEIELYRKYSDYYGYVFYIMKKIY